jgi:NAD-dependent SIR2 family protein deacetylase
MTAFFDKFCRINALILYALLITIGCDQTNIQKDAENDIYQKAAQLILDADALYIGAGAGMGISSGLGTFRGVAAGVWPPLEKLGLKFQDMSNPERFLDDDRYGPNLAWSFWQWRYKAYTGSEPHEGYSHLLDWTKNKKHPSFVFTSNIDGHFLRAGFNNVCEIHGTIKYLQCIRTDTSCPYYDRMWLPKTGEIEGLLVDPKTDKVTSPLPRCPGCNRVARPTVHMFNDWGVLRTLIDKQKREFEAWKTQNKNLKIVAIEIGAGTAIPTIRNESEKISREFSCPLIRINPEHPEINNAAPNVEHITIADAKNALQKIQEAIRNIAASQR